MKNLVIGNTSQLARYFPREGNDFISSRNIDVGKYFVQIYFTDIPRIDSSDLMSCGDLAPGQTECTMEAQTLAPGTDTDQPILGYAIGIFLIIIILYIISRSTRRPGAPF